MALRRPCTLRLDTGAANKDVTTRAITESLRETVEIEYLKCVTQTTKETWQITLDGETSRDVVLARDLDVNGRYDECAVPSAFVEVRMPYECLTMPFALYSAQVASSVHRQSYAFAPKSSNQKDTFHHHFKLGGIDFQ